MKELKRHGTACHANDELPTNPQSITGSSASTSNLPSIVAHAGAAAQFAWDEFIYGKIRNPHTRVAYESAIRQFMSHCEARNMPLHQITPRDVGNHLDSRTYAVSTKKLILSALRHFFDALVTRHVIILNPAATVRGERLQVVEGKTPEISVEQARLLLRSNDASHAVGLRDRAIIGKV